MDIPSSLVSSIIEEGKMYYFSSTKLNTSEPHHFICIKRSDQVLLFSCCTSKFESMTKFVQARKLREETIVTVPSATDGTKLTKHTYINCNEDPIEIALPDFIERLKNNSVKSTGTLPPEYMEKILIGIRASDMIDEEMKEFIGC